MMDQDMRTPAPGVLVIPSGFRAGPWAVRSLRRAGYRAVGAHQSGLLAGGRSLACPRPLRYPPPSADPGAFVAVLREICIRERIAVIVSGGEDETRVLAETPLGLEGTVVGPDADQYRALCDKATLGETAAAAGIAHPASVVHRAEGGPEGPLPPAPCVVKPTESGEDLGDSSAVVRAATDAERDAAIAALAAAGRDALVQEVVDGDGWVARCVRGPGVLEIAAFRVHREFPRGAGTPSLQTAAPAPAGLVEACDRLLGHVDYVGPASVCTLERDGVHHVHDVNLRFSGTLGGVMRAGLDVPRRVVEIALGRDVEPTPPGRRAVTYVRLDGELAALSASLRGRSSESPRRPLGPLVRGAVRPDWMLDPSPLDPLMWAQSGGQAVLSRLRALRRRARPQG